MDEPRVAVVMGSDSDLPIMKDAIATLEEFSINYKVAILSAHRSPYETHKFTKNALSENIKVVIAAAGGAAHLAGVIASQYPLPVIGVPIKSPTLSGIDSLYSTVQMPPGVPVATVGINGAKNAALLAIEILATSDNNILADIKKYKKNLANKVVNKSKKLQKMGVNKYLLTDKKEKPARSEAILKAHDSVFKKIDVPNLGKKYSGKVRDFYIQNGKRILITTDRQSAFDVILGHIPYKGAVLNLLSKFWFDKTKKIVANHAISTPDPNVTIARDCQPIPVEMIVRGYMTGVTKTSIWYSYDRGERTIYGLEFPEGLKKNQKLPQPVLTPTTHPEAGSDIHDERLTREEIIKKKIVPKRLYNKMEKAALELFEMGSKHCLKQGLILVDTKYEFGLYNGELMQIDEIHTPDSSRFWLTDTYAKRFKKGMEPDNFDKEFLRLRYANELNYRGDGSPPDMPKDIVVDLAERYIAVYEKITGQKFDLFDYPIEERIKKNIAEYLQ